MQNRIIVVITVVMLLVGIGIGFTVGYYADHPTTNKPQTVSVFAAGSLTHALGTGFYPQFKNITGLP